MQAWGPSAFVGGLLVTTAALANLSGSSSAQAIPDAAVVPPVGLVFHCSAQQLQHIQPALDNYLVREGVDLQMVRTRHDTQSHSLAYSLVEPLADAITLDLVDRAALHITEDLVELPTAQGGKRTVITVSKKEILYALLQTGRATVFDGQACDVQALIDHVGIRQNTVAWGETLSWQWPEGGPAVWNSKYCSNALYLGRGKFNDYYNDHHHAYTYKEKMHEVYQWRHKVFSRSRDVAKVRPLSAADFEQLTSTPQRGGIQMDFRAVPMLFGFQALPSLTL